MISLSAASPTRLDSASEMPGFSTMEMVSVPSLNGGRKARGRLGTVAAAIRTAAPTVANSVPGLAKAQPRSRTFPAFSLRTSQLSCSSSRFRRGSR